MKIAVLLFGHLRDFETCAPSLKSNLIDRYDCDVFMHTWDELDSKTYSWHEQRVQPENVSQWIDARIKELYHPKDFIVEHQEKWSDEQIITSTYTPSLTFSNAGMHFMFYSMNKANMLRKTYENKHKENYDYVVVTRPDVELLSSFNVERYIEQARIIGLPLNKCRFFAPMQPSSSWANAFVINGTNDILFFAQPNVIDTYIDTNEEISIEFIKKHDINIVSIFTSKEVIDGGLLPIPLSYSLGTDWLFSGSRKKENKKGILAFVARILAALLKPM